MLSEFFTKGGLLMWPLLLCSIVATAIVLERLWRLRRIKSRVPNLTARVRLLLKDGHAEEALKLCESLAGPVPHIVALAIRLRHRNSEEKERVLARAGAKTLRRLDARVRGLAIIANTAPLLGLLGTVTGMIAVFMKIQQAGGRVDPTVLAGGIWEALITTAFGLAVAIPSLVFYHYFEGRIDDIAAEMKDAAAEFIELSAAEPHR